MAIILLPEGKPLCKLHFKLLKKLEKTKNSIKQKDTHNNY